MTNAIPPAPEGMFIQSSPDADFYSIHERLLEPCHSHPEDKSFPITRGLAGNTGRPISYALLRELCQHLSVGKKVFVVVEHEHAFEIKRLNDGANAKLFYKFLKPNEVLKMEEADTSLETMRSLIKGFAFLNFDDIQKYDTSYNLNMKENNFISYAFIQRRMASVASFRKSNIGSTLKIKECLASLIEEGVLSELKADFVKNEYKLSSKLYKILNKGV